MQSTSVNRLKRNLEITIYKGRTLNFLDHDCIPIEVFREKLDSIFLGSFRIERSKYI